MSRFQRIRAGGVLLVLLTLVSVTVQAAVPAIMSADTSVYAIPATTTPVATLSHDTPIMIEGRNAIGNWLLVHSADASVRGWVMTTAVALPPETLLRDILAVEDRVLTADVRIPMLPVLPISDDPQALNMTMRLQSYPIFYNLDTPAVRDIFVRGQALGNRADVFTTIGDSNTTNGDFLYPIGLEHSVCSLGPFTYLQETIHYFSQTPALDAANSFVHDSAAAEMGFSTAALIDPFWADPTACESNESALLCEYRRVKPSVVVIMIGQIEVNNRDLNVESYRANMERIIQSSLEQGVIPVLTTIVFLPERDEWMKSLTYNMVILDLVDRYQIPLINLWSAVQSLPDYGIGPDRSHLSTEVGSFCDFDGAEQTFGGVMRNLLTLQALDELRRGVLSGV